MILFIKHSELTQYFRTFSNNRIAAADNARLIIIVSNTKNISFQIKRGYSTFYVYLKFYLNRKALAFDYRTEFYRFMMVTSLNRQITKTK